MIKFFDAKQPLQLYLHFFRPSDCPHVCLFACICAFLIWQLTNRAPLDFIKSLIGNYNGPLSSLWFLITSLHSLFKYIHTTSVAPSAWSVFVVGLFRHLLFKSYKHLNWFGFPTLIINLRLVHCTATILAWNGLKHKWVHKKELRITVDNSSFNFIQHEKP